jgi:hypothetical protein
LVIGTLSLQRGRKKRTAGWDEGQVAAHVASAGELMSQLGIVSAADAMLGIKPKALAGTVLRTLNLPQIAELTPHLLRAFADYRRK